MLIVWSAENTEYSSRIEFYMYSQTSKPGTQWGWEKKLQYIWGLEILRLKYSWTLGSQIPWICKSDSEVPSTYSPSISPSIWRKFFLSSIEFEMRFDCKERKCSWNFQLPSTYPWYLRYKYSWYWSSTVHGNKFVKWTE